MNMIQEDNPIDPSLLDQQQQNGESGGPQSSLISSFYPPPPMRYIKLFTDINVRNKCTPPPPKPFTNGQYLMFGQTITIDDTIIRSLESQGLRRLYPREYDHKRELKKMNASILVNFLDLIDVLIRCPDTPKREEKCNDLQLLFITMHHLINELRPHQARESIRVSLQVQKKQRIDTTMRLNKQIERVQELIKNSSTSIVDYNIASILQESLPENFEKSSTESTTTTTITIKTTDEDNNQQQQTKPPITNGHNHLNGDIKNIIKLSSLLPPNTSNIVLQPPTKMSQLDAIMCDLVDEIF